MMVLCTYTPFVYSNEKKKTYTTTTTTTTTTTKKKKNLQHYEIKTKVTNILQLGLL